MSDFASTDPASGATGHNDAAEGNLGDRPCHPRDAEGSRDAEGDLGLMAACGGSTRPNTLQDFFRMQVSPSPSEELVFIEGRYV